MEGEESQIAHCRERGVGVAKAGSRARRRWKKERVSGIVVLGEVEKEA